MRERAQQGAENSGTVPSCRAMAPSTIFVGTPVGTPVGTAGGTAVHMRVGRGGGTSLVDTPVGTAGGAVSGVTITTYRGVGVGADGVGSLKGPPRKAHRISSTASRSTMPQVAYVPLVASWRPVGCMLMRYILPSLSSTCTASSCFASTALSSVYSSVPGSFCSPCSICEVVKAVAM